MKTLSAGLVVCVAATIISAQEQTPINCYVNMGPPSSNCYLAGEDERCMWLGAIIEDEPCYNVQTAASGASLITGGGWC